MAKKILIVEDNVAIAENLFDFLELTEFEPCGIAKSYDEAVMKFKEVDPDFVILDINLEGELTGIDVAEFIRSNSNVPFIYFSAAVEAGLLEKAMTTKPAAFLSKPGEFANIMGAINSAFEEKFTANVLQVSVISKAVSVLAPNFMIPNLIPTV